MAKKLISLLLALTVFAGAMTLTGCSNVHKLKDQVYGYFDNRIRLLLKGEYEQQFKDGLTAENLAFDNIKRYKNGEPTMIPEQTQLLCLHSMAAIVLSL